MNDKPEIKPQGISPLKHICMTIGELPSSYLETMTYYEMLLWFTKYLQETLIPAINNNAEALDELQNLYIELQNYVNNYFDNLDVQEEINNKLDNMVQSGELQQLLNLQYQELRNEVNEDITNFENDVNSVITEQNNKINSLHNFTPIVVNNTSQMTDQTKVYLLTTDDNWYYYNGSEWVVGGSYQSQAIANGSIDILKLDSILQNTFEMNYDECEELENAYQGYIKDNDGVVQIVTTSPSTISYKYYVINLELGGIYTYTGKNNNVALGLTIADSDGNIILKTSGNIVNNVTFKANESGLKAYVGVYIRDSFEASTSYEFTLFNESSVLRKLKSITNKLDQISTPSFVQTIENVMNISSTLNNMLELQHSTSYETYMYSCKINDKFRITYKDYYLVKGLTITDKNYIVKYIGDTATNETTIEWTATFDGYIFLTKIPEFTPSINKIIDGIDVNTDGVYSIIKNKTIIYDGDSITESRINAGNQSNGGAYPKLIADLTDSYYLNYAVGGGTLSYHDGQSSHSVVNGLSSLSTTGDMYVFSGGVNDYWSNVQLGTLTSNYTDEVDVSTLTGALEYIFRYALTNFLGKPILFVITHKLNNPFYNGSGYTQFQMHDRIVEVCKKYSIPYYDAFNESGLNGWNSAQKNAYLNSNASGTPDGTHPNENGYLKYYVPQIIELLNANILK